MVGAHNNNNAGFPSGSAYIFVRDDGGVNNWGQVPKLAASDAAVSEQFGFSVSVSGDTAVVGAFANDDAGESSGSAYIFVRDEGGVVNWGEVAKLTASDAALGDFFGFSVSVAGNTTVMGAFNNDDAGNTSGSAYVFRTAKANCVLGPKAKCKEKEKKK